MLLPLLLLMVFSLPVSAAAPAESDVLRVMFYNVENLFDVKHDEGKQDWEFLPLSHPGKKQGCALVNDYFRQRCLETDWSQTKLGIKLDQISRVVLHEGRPDLLGLSEVENLAVLKELATRLGYSHYLITEGNDPRGIDVALLYNGNDKHFTYQQHRSHRLRTGQHLRKPTRDFLEVEFRMTKSSERLVVYVMHWPAQHSPSQARMVTARRSVELLREQQRRDSRVNVIMMGDFNVIAADYPHPFRKLFDSRLLDAHRGYMKHKSITREQRQAMAMGTYFYPPKMEWNRLDRIFYNKNLADNKGLELVVPSFRVLAYPWLTRTFTYRRPGEFLLGSTVSNVPTRYNFNATSADKAGFSDHFALSVNLRHR